MTRQEVMNRLKSVHDPEIPGLSIVDMGAVLDVAVADDMVQVTLRPTYIGCPALDWIRSAVEKALAPAPALVRYEMTALWSTADMSSEGHAQLKAFGIAPPQPGDGPIACPHCGSDDTELTSPFGSALCRAIHYCRDCQEPFEAWKTV